MNVGNMAFFVMLATKFHVTHFAFIRFSIVILGVAGMIGLITRPLFRASTMTASLKCALTGQCI